MAMLSAAVALVAAGMGLAGCGDFFVCAKSSCTNSTSGSTTTSGNFVYVSNSTTGQTYLSIYNIASGSLTAVGSAFSLGYVPVAMKVTPNNAFLFVASGAGGIYRYAIGSTGALTVSGNSPLLTTTTGSASSLDISPDGNFLFVMDSTGIVLSEYALTASTGALSNPATFPIQGNGCALIGTPVSQSCTVAVSPANNYVAVALGSVGTVVFPFSTANGITSANYSSIACCNSVVTSPSGDFSLAFDTNSYLYIARTAAVSSYSVTGTTTTANQANATYASGVTPRSVTLSQGYNYLYTANEGNSTISSFGLSGAAVLTALSTASVAGPTNVSALAVDSTGTYLVATGYNASSGVQLFKPSSGLLGAAVASAGTGTNLNYPALLALTH